MKHVGVPVAYRPPFALNGPCWRDERPSGESIMDIVLSVPNLPAVFFDRGVVCINGEVVPRQLWANVRPKPASQSLPVAVTLHLPLAGGAGGGGAKAVGGLVAAFALVLLTAGIATGAVLGGLSASFGATLGLTAAQGAAILAGGVGLAGSLAIAALTPPPSVDNSSGGSRGDDHNTDQKEAAGADGNVIAPGGAVPRVIGTRKIYPPFICEPLVELVGDDEYVEVACALNGPHLIEDIRINDATIDDADDVESEVREGWASDEDLTLVTRCGHTVAPQITMSVHVVNPDAQTNLLHQSNPSVDLPKFHRISSITGPDEIWLHLYLPNGISVNGSTSTDIRIPFRIQIRKRGDVPWINLPEIHLSDSTLQQRRRAIIFKFENGAGQYEDVIPPGNSGFMYANINVPGQSVAPSTSGWAADSYFVGASGADHVDTGDIGATKVKNIAIYANRVEVFLDPATFTSGIYEIQIMRGAAFQSSSFNNTTYAYSGTVKDFFTYSGTSPSAVIPMSRSNLADVVQIIRVSSVKNTHPVQAKGFALLAIRAVNRNLQRISVNASGYVQDYVSSSPSGWTGWTTTSNPAPHYRDILAGTQNLDPLPADLIDDDGLVAWRTLCEDNGWTCDAIIDDMRTQDALSLLASCGYAKPYQSDIYGVTVDNDRSLDSPVQVFSRLNATNVRFEKAFARVPDGFSVTFRDNASDNDRAQTIVYQRDRSLATTGLLESISYEGLIDEAKVQARALFDLDQGNQRSTFYYLDSDVESIVCRRGDLVGLQHDVLTPRAGDARVLAKVISAGNITGFVLDSDLPIITELDMHAITDMHSVTDMHTVGIQTGIALRRIDGTISTHALSNATGDTDQITLTSPIADTSNILGFEDTDREYGCMVVSGALASEYRRLLVAGITATSDLKASLVLVDEAPELVRYAP